MDILTKEQRRRTMQAVRSKDTGLERKLRHALWSRGHRYRKNYSRVRGRPDIAFIRHRIAVFCDSEFWHGFDWENRKRDIKSNRKFWYKKIERNMERDREVNRVLRRDGWIVLRLWGHEIEKAIDNCIKKIEKAIDRRRTESA